MSPGFGGGGVRGGSCIYASGASDSVAGTNGSPGRDNGGIGQRRRPIHINLASCKYPVLRVVQQQLGWAEVDDEAAHVFWCDTSAGIERLVRLSRQQKLNHFVGMLEVARKKGLARNLCNMRALFPKHYDFNPHTFLLPEQMEAFLAELNSSRKTSNSERGGRPTFILKLDNGSMGRGIRLVQTAVQAAVALPSFEHENVVASQYLPCPLLIDGFKFDLRIYVLVRCCAPLRVFLCREGLVRLCTERYAPPAVDNLDHACMHLSNYAINKQSPSFVFNRDSQHAGDGSKWTISAFAEWMWRQGHDFEGLWGRVKEIVAKTLISIQPMLQYQYECATKPNDDGLTCFELLGLDVLIDEGLRPWLLEVNHSPSLSTDTPLDLEVKSRVVREVLELVGVQVERVHAELAAQERAKQQRLYAGAAPGVATTCAKGGAVPVPAAASAAAAVTSNCGTDRNSCSSCQQPGTASVVSEQPSQDAAIPVSIANNGSRAAPVADAVPEPKRGSTEWLAVQEAYEDAHLGQFERILPPDDELLAALYERLLAGSRQVFHRSTMQGRNQQKLNELRQRRQREEAEAAAQREVQQRRAEALKQWMAGVCQKHKEQEQHAASTAPAAAAGGASGVDQADISASDSTLSGSSGGSRCNGEHSSYSAAASAAAACVLQEHFSHFSAAHQALPPTHEAAPGPAASSWQPRGVTWRRSSGLVVPEEAPAAAGAKADSMPASGSAGAWLSITGATVASAACSDSARNSTTGGGGGSLCSTFGTTCMDGSGLSARHPSSGSQLSSQNGSAVAVTLESVIGQRQAAAVATAGAASGGGTAQRSPPASRPSSAAVAAWEAVRRHGSTAEPDRPASSTRQDRQVWQQQAWDAHGRPIRFTQTASSSAFLEQVAALQKQASAESALQAKLQRLCLISEDAHGSCSGSGEFVLGSGPAGDFGCRSSSSSLQPSATESACVQTAIPHCSAKRTPTAGPYIPPAMLNALHTARMSPMLAGMHCGSPCQGAAGSQQHQRRQPAAAGIGGNSSSSRRNGGERRHSVGQATLGLPWVMPAGAKGGVGAGSAQALVWGGATEPQCGAPSWGTPGLSPGVRRHGPNQSPKGAPAGSGSSTSNGSSASAAKQRQYRKAIEQQAVKSVADLISGIIHTRGL